MAGKGYSTVQLLNDDDESDEELLTTGNGDELKFQEFTSAPDTLEGSLKNKSVGGGSDDNDEDDDNLELLSSKKSPSFWTFEYYQSFFDVDTKQVLSRIKHSMIPSKSNFLLTRIRPNPDLYGPFWICATLVFTIAICGNLSSFFVYEGQHQWKSDFRLVSLSATVIYLYAWLVPACLWGFLLWRGNRAGYSFLEIVSVYGYSLAVFVPISILWLIPFEAIRWLLVLIGALTSGIVLLVTFWRAVEDEQRNITIISLSIIFLLHTLLAIGFKLYFFKTIKIHPPPSPTATEIQAATTRATVVNTTKLLLSTTLKALNNTT